VSFEVFLSQVLLSFLFSQLLLFAQAQPPATTAILDRNVQILAGSYQLTCLIVDIRKDQLRATCQREDGDWVETELRNPSSCTADISNENGKLTCNRNQSAPGAYFDAFGEGATGIGERLGP
jgi:hypothetical protein